MRVEFHFDFASPNSFMAHRVIPKIEERTGASFEYVPVLLGGVFKLTGNVPPMVSLQGIKNKPEYQALEMQRFIAKHSIDDYRFNPHFPINTLQPMRGAIVAGRLGCLESYVETIFRFMWSEPRKLDDPEVLETSLREAGLDADALLSGAADPEVKAALIANTEASVERGVFGSPSFFVGEELFFGKDRLEDVEREIVARS